MKVHHLLFILHLLALAAGLGASICGTVFAVATGRMDQAESAAFMGRAGPLLSRIGASGLLVLIATGVAMLAYAPGMVAAGGTWFHVKLVFVLAAIAIVGFIHLQQARLARGDDPTIVRPRLRLAVRASMIAASGALICAVLAFH